MVLSFMPARARMAAWIRRVSLLAAFVLPAMHVSAAPAFALRTPVDHSAFDLLLRQHVVNGLVDYDAFGRSAEFSRYLALLDRVDPASLDDNERLAYWINVYNAYTIELVNRHKERASIRNINKSFGFLRLKGPWSEQLVRAAGRTLSLDDVEHRIIRKEFHEPRVHFALVCAALGCPPLRSEAYTGARLDAQLDDQARRFLLRSPEKNRVDVATGTVYVSMIFRLYRDDFGGTDASVGAFIARWYPEGAERLLLQSGKYSLRETDYDWSLNGMRR